MKKGLIGNKFANEYVFFFVALVLNYTWRALSQFATNSFHALGDYSGLTSFEWFWVLGSNLVGWGFDNLVSIIVWLLSLYSLYLLYLNIKGKKNYVSSLILLILGVLFYAITIFY